MHVPTYVLLSIIWLQCIIEDISGLPAALQAVQCWHACLNTLIDTYRLGPEPQLQSVQQHLQGHKQSSTAEALV